MNTLTAEPVAPLLDLLFTIADDINPAAFLDLSRAEIGRIMHSKADYADFYARLNNVPLAVSRGTEALLYMLVRATPARSIVEFRTSFGLSTLPLAASLRDNGGGRIVTTESEPSKIARAKANLAAGGLADLVEPQLRPGAVVAADNAGFHLPYLDHMRAPDGGYMSVAFADDVELSIRNK